MLLAPRLFFHLSGIVFLRLHPRPPSAALQANAGRVEAEKKNQVNPVILSENI